MCSIGRYSEGPKDAWWRIKGESFYNWLALHETFMTIVILIFLVLCSVSYSAHLSTQSVNLFFYVFILPTHFLSKIPG